MMMNNFPTLKPKTNLQCCVDVQPGAPSFILKKEGDLQTHAICLKFDITPVLLYLTPNPKMYSNFQLLSSFLAIYCEGDQGRHIKI